MNSREYMGARRQRDYNFVEQLHAVQELTQQDGDDVSSALLALLVVEIGYAIRVRGCSVDEVINAIHRLQPEGSVLDDVPTQPATPSAKERKRVINADRGNLKWRRRWREMLLTLKGKK